MRGWIVHCLLATSLGPKKNPSRRPTALFGVETVKGPFSSDMFESSEAWGCRPLLVRGAFDADSLLRDEWWPSWEPLMELTKEVPCRTIRHVPKDLGSFTLEWGPLRNNNDDDKTKWTVVMNDVEQYYPPLADWMDREFGFLPRWRRDDGQVSLATTMGGIGPHVDNYDVFLIQMTGQREWQIQNSILMEHKERLIPDLDVRILRDWKGFQSVCLSPGDLLYLPPRFAHCGWSQSDDCTTLSVGCRAPCASQLVSRIAEQVCRSQQPSAVARYRDPSPHTTTNEPHQHHQRRSINQQVKQDMKQLVLDAIHDILDNDPVWDELVGKLVTESNRPREDYPTALDDMDKSEIDDLGVWGQPNQAIQNVLEGKGALYRAEGISFAYSLLQDGSLRLYANGRAYPVEQDSSPVCELIAQVVDGPCLNSAQLQATADNPHAIQLLERLLREGLLYGSP